MEKKIKRHKKGEDNGKEDNTNGEENKEAKDDEEIKIRGSKRR